MPETTLQRKSILEMARGAIMERADYACGEVYENIMDPNTEPRKPRKLTLTITFTPSHDRSTVHVSAVSKNTLVPTGAVETTLYTLRDQAGNIAPVEATPEVPGQLSIDGEEQEQPARLRLISGGKG